jgi:selenocysteine-specific elongation factor
LLQASAALGPVPLREIVHRARLDPEQALQALEPLIELGSLVILEEGKAAPDSDVLAVARPQWESLSSHAVEVIELYHRSFPLRRGIPREELKSRLKLTARVNNAILHKLSQEQQLVEAGAFLYRSGFQVTYTSEQQQKMRHCLDRFAQNPFSPPAINEVRVELGEDLYNALVESGQLKPVSPEVVFRTEDYEKMTREVRKQIEQNGSITLAQFRDRFNTTRKYAQAMLEHLDQIGVTIREGDVRKLRETHKSS